MGFRFYRRVRLFRGVSVNLSRFGPSLSVGVRGAHVTLGRRGVTKTVGLPGTGVFYTSRHGFHTGYHSAHSDFPLTPDAQQRATQRAEVTLLIGVAGILAALAIVALR